MPFKDPIKQRDYQREWKRSQRAGEPSRRVRSSTADIRTAQDMLDILTEMLGQLLAADADLFMKARVVAYVVSVGLKACETAELERRINEIEKIVLSGRNNGHILTEEEISGGKK